MGKTRPALDRFCEKVKVISNGCWIWHGNKNKNGYGTFHNGNGVRSKPAHRWSYEHYVGPIPKGLHIDHFYCRTPSCVNPKHLEPVTLEENNKRRWYWEKENKNGKCKNGHDLTPDSIYFYGGTIKCKICHKRYSLPSVKKRSEARKAANALKPRYKTPIKIHCKRGHLLEGANIHVNKKDCSARTCRTCYLERQNLSCLKRRHPEKYKALYGTLTFKECLDRKFGIYAAST